MGIVQDEVMKCHITEICHNWLCWFVCSHCGKKKKQKTEQIYRLLQPSRFWAASLVPFFSCGVDASQESGQSHSETLMEGVKA